MKFEAILTPSTASYHWKLWDGPDGIDFYEGEASSLGECFEEIVKHRILNSLHYTTD